MILKHADDQSARLRVLENLLPSPRLSPAQRKRLERDIETARLGAQGEKDAAYYIDFHFGPSKNNVVLHDLRLRDGTRQAQIDHLIIDRTLTITVIETKNFGADVEISAQGEFTLRYGAKRFGIESPIEQNERHISVLRALMDRIELPTRLGLRLRPTFRSAIVFAPRAVIQRPDARSRDTSCVLKADQFRAWWNESLGGESVLAAMAGMARLVSADTVQALARAIVAQHQPADALALPAYLAPQPERVAAPDRTAARPAAAIAAPAVAGVSVAGASALAERVTAPQENAAASTTADVSAAPAACADCGKPLSEKVEKFCRDNAARFNGALLCYTHQRSRRPA
jgi:hypothetical protein